jgi:hypothetical protein
MANKEAAIEAAVLSGAIIDCRGAGVVVNLTRYEIDTRRVVVTVAEHRRTEH